jgi:hypothetical protein
MHYKHTFEEVKEYFESEGYALLSNEYIDSITHMTVKCPNGHIYETNYNNFKNNKRRCKFCRNKFPDNYNDIKNFIEVDSDSGCKLLSKEYFNATSKLDIECKCGNKFKASFYNFKKINQRQCKKCGLHNNNRLTYEEVKHFIEVESNSECKLISKEYISQSEKLEIQCNCGEIFQVDFKTFKRDERYKCKKCSKQEARKMEFKKLQDFVKNNKKGFELSCNESDYKTARSALLMKCDKGHIYNTRGMDIKRYGCPICSGFYQDTESFKNRIYKLVGDEYTVLGEYKGADKKIKIKHNVCGHIWNPIASNFVNNGRRCPKCAYSKGEDMICKILDKNKLNYQAQYRFNDCKNIKPLPFDFAIFNKDNELLFLIEYQGEQHYQPVKFNSISDEKANENLVNTRKRDNMKKIYCENNSITLLIIKYNEFENLEKIINKKLDEYKLI